MKKSTPVRACREIDAKSKELMQEFFDHVRLTRLGVFLDGFQASFATAKLTTTTF